MTDPDYDALSNQLVEQLGAELTVESDGDRVTNRSVGDIERALNIIDNRKAQAGASARRANTTVVSFSPE